MVDPPRGVARMVASLGGLVNKLTTVQTATMYQSSQVFQDLRALRRILRLCNERNLQIG